MTFPRPGVAVKLWEQRPLDNSRLSDQLRDFLRLMPMPTATDPEILEIVLEGRVPLHYVEASGLCDRFLPYVREIRPLGDRAPLFVPYWVAAAVLGGIPAREVTPYSGRFHAALSLRSKSPWFSRPAALACLAKYRKYA